MKYFLYNKAVDFKKGYMENCVWCGNGLTVENPGLSGGGSFITRVMDSREKETVWHRLGADCEALGNASIQLSLYVSESDRLLVDGKVVDLQAYLRNPEISMEEKRKRLASFLVKTVLSPADLLLYDVKGRYLWAMVRMFSQGGARPVIHRLQFFFPKESWTRHLPNVYRVGLGENSFLERYLAIFQSMYGDLEQEIRQADRLLDTEIADPQVLEWLAGWIFVDNVSLWPRDRLRRFLKEAVRLYAIRGTRKGLLGMVELYTGDPAFLVEHMELEPVMTDVMQRERWERLYGTEKNCCFLLVMETAVSEPGQKKAVEALIESIRPAHISVQLVVLKPRMVLGSHCYLGVNTRLEHLRPFVLDGASHLAFSALKDSRQDTEGRS